MSIRSCHYRDKTPLKTVLKPACVKGYGASPELTNFPATINEYFTGHWLISPMDNLQHTGTALQQTQHIPKLIELMLLFIFK